MSHEFEIVFGYISASRAGLDLNMIFDPFVGSTSAVHLSHRHLTAQWPGSLLVYVSTSSPIAWREG